MFKFIGIIVTVLCISYTAVNCLKVGVNEIEVYKNKIEQSINQSINHLTMSGMEKRQYYAHMRRDARDINGKIEIYATLLNELYRHGTYSEMKCIRLFNDFVSQKRDEFIAKYGEENVSRIKYEQFLD